MHYYQIKYNLLKELGINPPLSIMKKLYPLIGFLLITHLSGIAQLVDPNFNPKIYGVPKVYCHEVQSDGKILLSGDFVRFGDESVGSIIRVNADGTLDDTFSITNEIGDKRIDRIEQISSDYILLSASGQGGAWVLNIDGSLKTNIDKEISKNGSYNYTLGAFAVDEEKILLRKSGSKYEYVMINIQGDISEQFHRTQLPFQDRPQDIAIQEDGKIIIAGYHNPIIDDTQYGYVRRLNIDGTEDKTFDVGSGLDKSNVNNIEIDKQGRIYLCGPFNSFNGESVPYGIIRLFSNGSLDYSFSLQNISDYPDLSVSDIEIMPDGSLIIVGVSYIAEAQVVLKIDSNGFASDNYEKTNLFPHYHYRAELEKHGDEISVSGIFHSVNGQDKYGIIWLNQDGSIKREFDMPLGSMASITLTTLQDDGKIMIGGSFYSNNKNNNESKNKNLVRLTTSGTIDDFESPFQHRDYITSLVQMENGKYLVSGDFESTTFKFTRLNNDGSIDNSFTPNVNGQADKIIPDIEGNFIMAGNFSFDQDNQFMRSKLIKISKEGFILNSFNSTHVFPRNHQIYAIDSLKDGSLIIGGVIYGDDLGGFVWKLNSNASEILWKNEEIPYYFVRHFSVFDEKIIVSGGRGYNPTGVVQLDLNGNIINDNFVSIEEDQSNWIHPDPILFTSIKLSENEILLGGRFNSINTIRQSGLAKVSMSGVVNKNFVIDTNGYRSRINEIVKINSDSAYVSGYFDGINDINFNGIAKIRISDITPPEIISQKEIPSVKEDSSFEIDIKTLEIDQEYDIAYSKIKIYDGEHYSLDKNKVTLEEDYYGNLVFSISILNGVVESDKFSYQTNITPLNDAPVIVEQIETPSFYKGSTFHITSDVFNIEDPDNDQFEINIIDGDNYTHSTDGILVSETFEDNSINIYVVANDGELLSEAFVMKVNLEEAILAIPENFIDSEIVDIYPIPSNDIIQIDLKVASSSEIEIFNLSGKKIYSRQFYSFSKNQLNLNHIQNGIYILTLKTEDYTVSKRIIKN